MEKRDSERQLMRPRLSVGGLALVLVVISSYSYVSGADANHVSEKEAILKLVQYPSNGGCFALPGSLVLKRGALKYPVNPLEGDNSVLADKEG